MNRLRVVPQLLFFVAEVLCFAAIYDRFAQLSGFGDFFAALGYTYLICIGVMLANVLLHPIHGYFDYQKSVFSLFVGAVFAPVFFLWHLVKHPFVIVKVLLVGQRAPLTYKRLFARYLGEVGQAIAEYEPDERATDLGGPLGTIRGNQLQTNLRRELRRISAKNGSYKALGWASGPKISEGFVSNRVCVSGTILFSADATDSDIENFLSMTKEKIISAEKSVLRKISANYKGYDQFTVEVKLGYKQKS